MRILRISLFVSFFLLLSVSVFSFDANPIDYGAVPDDDLDDSAAIQAAVDAVISKGGGTLILPSGKLNINNIVRMVPTAYFGGELKIKGSRGSFVEISVGIDGFAIYAGNLNVLSLEDIVFVGKNVPEAHPQFFDAKYVLFTTFTQHTNVIRCQFFGLATPSGGAVIYFGNTDARVVDSQFDGSLGQYPDGAVILAENSRGLTVSRATFIDYANYVGGYISKTTAFTGSWIKVTGGLPLGGNGVRRIVVEDSRFDEGAASGIWISDVSWAMLSGNSFNLNSSSEGKGIYLKNVEHAKVEQSWFGYANVRRPALDLVNVKAIEVTSLKLGGGVYFLRRQNVESLIVRFCPQCTTRIGQSRPSR